MGTRCDFYAGRGLNAIYLGSIGHDAYVVEMAARFKDVTDRASFDSSLQQVFKEYGEIPAKNGWPWPWRTSDTTDTVVAYDEGQCWTAHYDGCWAPLQDFENPTALKCEFPDMAAELEKTPEGRLSKRLRFGTDMRMGATDEVMVDLLCYVGRLLSKMLLHGFWKDEQLHVLNSLSSFERVEMELFSVASVLEQQAQEFDPMLAESRAANDEAAWDLLKWFREHPGRLATEEVELPLTADLPTYFATPAPVQERDRSLTYLKITDPGFAELHSRWETLIAAAPHVYAQELAKAIVEHGLLPVKRAEADAWFNAPQPEFGGMKLVDCCATAVGRALAVAWAGKTKFED